jgi:phosphoadenosine phosphosulfate reductase
MLPSAHLIGIRRLADLIIEDIQQNEPEDGYYVADSGGKDSSVVLDLVKRAKVKFDSHYMATTVDPPELVRFVREYHPESQFHYPPSSYFKEIVKRGVPLRNRRWCCEFLKEYGGKDRVVVTGIRKWESAPRKKRKATEGGPGKRFVHPIFEWSSEEVWMYIKEFDLPYCELYDQGWKRIGCLGCPMGSRRGEELSKYPRIERAYRRAVHELYERNKNREPYQRWSSGEDMFQWWING